MVVQAGCLRERNESLAGVARQGLHDDFWNPVPDQGTKVFRNQDEEGDFWLPVAIREQDDFAGSAPKGELLGASEDYWWDGAEAIASTVAHKDWEETASLPWFDPHLSSNPYIVSTNPRSAQTHAERRGRWLAQLLEIPLTKERQKYARLLAEVFEQFPSQATFLALSDIAIAGVAPDALASGCAFRCDFRNTSALASRRYLSQRTPYAAHDALSLLSWRRAVRMAELCRGENPTDHIDPDWYFDWLTIPRESELYSSYLDYVEWRLRAAALGYNSPHQRASDRSYREITLLHPSCRTGEFSRGQSDHVGVLYAEPMRPTLLLRS